MALRSKRRNRGACSTCLLRPQAFACDAAGEESKEPGELEARAAARSRGGLLAAFRVAEAKLQPEAREAEEPLALEEAPAPDGAAADSADICQRACHLWGLGSGRAGACGLEGQGRLELRV